MARPLLPTRVRENIAKPPNYPRFTNSEQEPTYLTSHTCASSVAVVSRAYSLLFSLLMSFTRAFKKTPPKTAVQTLACMRGFCVCWRCQENISFFELTMTGTSSTVAAKTLRFLYAPPPESPLSVHNLPFATPRTVSIYAAMAYCESHLRVLPCHLCRSCVVVG